MNENIEFSPDGDGAIKAVYRRNGQLIFSAGKFLPDSSPESMKKAKAQLAHACITACGDGPI